MATKREPTTMRGRVNRQQHYLRRLQTPNLPLEDRQSLTIGWLLLEVANLRDLQLSASSLLVTWIAGDPDYAAKVVVAEPVAAFA